MGINLSVKREKIRAGCYWLRRSDGKTLMARRGVNGWWSLNESGPFTKRKTLGAIIAGLQFGDWDTEGQEQTQ